MHRSTRIADDIEACLQEHRARDLLRVITCGSVDDGKSTLLGRLLYESKLIFDDHLAAVTRDSQRIGTQGDELDLALLVDGLAAEREQGITIDVAYRYFSTDRRTFIVADTPGHEQYTRNMATGASTADAAVILVDARKGLLTQTRRHGYLVSLLGIRHVVLAVNKMDVVGYRQDVFTAIDDAFRAFAASLGFEATVGIPVSALRGDNVTSRSPHMPWYEGPSLMAHLETLPIARSRPDAPFRMPVQRVSRPHQDFRGFAGMVVDGQVRPGDAIVVQPSGRESRVARLVGWEEDLAQAVAGQSILLTLEDEIDVSRGDVIAAAASPPPVADQFQVSLVWMHEDAMLPGRPYLMKIGTNVVSAQITDLRYAVNVNTLEHVAASRLDLNEIGICNIATTRPVPFETYAENRDMGGFVLIDTLSHDTVGAGMIRFALRRAGNVHWQALDVNREARAAIKGQRPCVVWFTGLSGSGKSTIANLVEKRLHAMGRHTVLLDGDNVRHGLNRDLGFTDADRVENIRRVAEVARLMTDAGLIVLVSFISPFRSERRLARGLMAAGEFLEVYVDTPLEEAERRDPKGLYRKAREGRIANFTGIDSPYEPPERAELVIDGMATSADEAAEAVVAMVTQAGGPDGPPVPRAPRSDDGAGA